MKIEIDDDDLLAQLLKQEYSSIKAFKHSHLDDKFLQANYLLAIETLLTYYLSRDEYEDWKNENGA